MGRATINQFVPEVLDAIYLSLKDKYLKVVYSDKIHELTSLQALTRINAA